MHLKGTRKIRVMPAHSAEGILLFACSALTHAQAMLAQFDQRSNVSRFSLQEDQRRMLSHQSRKKAGRKLADVWTYFKIDERL